MNTFFGKSFKKNLIFIISIIIIFTLVLFFVLQINNSKSIQKEILNIEQQKINKMNISILSQMNQITKINCYFSTVVLKEHTYPLLEQDVSWYASLNERSALCISTMDYIRLIRVTNGNASYQTAGYYEEIMSDPENLVTLGEMNATEIIYIKNCKTDALMFRITPEPNDYAENNVLILANSSVFGETILNGNVNGNSVACVVDRDGNIVLSNNFDDLGGNLFSLYELSGKTKIEEKKMISLKGVKYSYCSEKIGNLDLYSVSLTDQSTYASYYTAMQINTVIFGAVLFVLSFLISLLIAYRTYRPLRNLIKSLNNHMPELSIRKNLDEIAYIQDNIANLYSNNHNLKQVVNEDIKLLKNQQAIALQSQISPHFTYNTLDAINWTATDLIGRKNPISACVINMANIIKYSMDSSTLFATLSEELSITKMYVEILKVRYNNKYELEWDVDESLLDSKVIKICIQPIIENAVFHGLSKTPEKGRISVRVYSEEKDLKIEISDNGIGISAEALEKINRHINDFENLPPNHIGLRNVNMRLKLLYGEKYGVFIKNRETNGVTCYLLLPVKRNGD